MKKSEYEVSWEVGSDQLKEFYNVERARNHISEFYRIKPNKLKFNGFEYYRNIEIIIVSFKKVSFFHLNQEGYDISISTKDGSIHRMSSYWINF